MKKLMLAAAALALSATTLSATPAFARQCPMDMKKIDAALAQNPSVDADKLAQVRQLRAEGEALHEAGNHPASEAKLAEAKTILGIQ